MIVPRRARHRRGSPGTSRDDPRNDARNDAPASAAHLLDRALAGSEAAKRELWDRLLPGELARRWRSADARSSETYKRARELIAQGELEAAERLLRRRLDAIPRAGHSLYTLGLAVIAQGRYEEGKAIIDRAIEVKPWTRDLPVESLDLTPHLEALGERFPEWGWSRFQQQRHRFRSVGLTLENAAKECLPGEAFVLQIGANDGVRADPLHDLIRRYPWRGLLIEPVPAAFEQLVANSADIADRFALANVAITPDGADLEILVDPARPTTLASFKPERTQLGATTSPLHRVAVTGTTVAALLADHGVTQVDLLQTDCEGSDGEVVAQFDLARFRPAVINLEHYSLTWEERIELCTRLASHGYAWRFGVMDLVAIDAERHGRAFAVVERDGAR